MEKEVSYPYLEIYFHYNFKCQYCGRSADPLDFESYLYAGLTIDHIKPKKYKGTNRRSNLVVACYVCNKLKGSRDCNSISQAKQIIAQKKEIERRWWEKNIRNNPLLRSKKGGDHLSVRRD